jgi:hypothetical protein
METSPPGQPGGWARQPCVQPRYIACMCTQVVSPKDSNQLCNHMYSYRLSAVTHTLGGSVYLNMLMSPLAAPGLLSLLLHHEHTAPTAAQLTE